MKAGLVLEKSSSYAWTIPAVFFQYRRRHLLTPEGKGALVLNKPFNNLTTLKLHGLSDGGGKVNVPLLTLFALDELNLGGEAHAVLLLKPKWMNEVIGQNGR